MALFALPDVSFTGVSIVESNGRVSSSGKQIAPTD